MVVGFGVIQFKRRLAKLANIVANSLFTKGCVTNDCQVRLVVGLGVILPKCRFVELAYILANSLFTNN